MKGDAKVLELLNDVLKDELTAINQYWIHARMCEAWGYEQLWQKIRVESIDEMKHADKIIERILLLDGIPNLQALGKINVGQDVKEQFELDLEIEKVAVTKLNGYMEKCRELGDHGSRDLFKEILLDEEQHYDWLETQLEIIKSVGLENYLAKQL